MEAAAEAQAKKQKHSTGVLKPTELQPVNLETRDSVHIDIWDLPDLCSSLFSSLFVVAVF